MSNKTNESVQIIKETSALGRLLIKPVSKAIAREMIVANHYSHKWNDGGFGVLISGYSMPMSRNDVLEWLCMAI